jgi:hypothetical protein
VRQRRHARAPIVVDEDLSDTIAFTTNFTSNISSAARTAHWNTLWYVI